MVLVFLRKGEIYVSVVVYMSTVYNINVGLEVKVCHRVCICGVRSRSFYDGWVWSVMDFSYVSCG